MNPIWQKEISLELIQEKFQKNAISHLGIEFTGFDDNSIEGKMPVDHRTKQPFGLLHGGASVLFAESLGSLGAFYACPQDAQVVGLDINANHMQPVTSGWVYGQAHPLQIGQKIHVWQVNIKNSAGILICASRLTLAILRTG